MTPDPFVRGLGLGMRLEGGGREEGEEGGGGRGRKGKEGEGGGGRGRREREEGKQGKGMEEVERSETHMLTCMQNGRIDLILAVECSTCLDQITSRLP